MKPTPADIEQNLSLLAETPRRIGANTLSVPQQLLHNSPRSKEWSVVENLAHLRACADLWMHSIYAMLAMDDPVLPLIDPRRWAKITSYASLDFQSSFRVFTFQREELLRVLRDLPLGSWDRGADIGGRRHTVFSQARRMAKHEEEHCAQIEAILQHELLRT